jgi:hypothetical protein
MKLIITEYEDHADVTVRDASGINLHVFTFDDYKQARSFCQGFNCAKSVANSLIQSMPVTWEKTQA